MARFEVQGLDRDRALIRALARKLAEDGPDAERTRTLAETLVTDREPGRGRVLAALRRSPFVGADLDLERSYEAGRDIDL